MFDRVAASLRWRSNAVRRHASVATTRMRATLDLPTATDYTARLIATGECSVALDVGCGASSHLTTFRNRIRTVGVDAFQEALGVSRSKDAHDEYVLADLLQVDLSDPAGPFRGRKFDLVTLYGVIEHFPKEDGFALLRKCEELSSKYVLLETPNGYCPQGPEYGNPFQRHLSGWFIEDFVGRCYDVYGTTGTRYLRGYAARPKYDFPGAMDVDLLLARSLRADRSPRHAFNLVAVKDVRGVPARLSRENPHNRL